jgi:TRAP-type C4-dicarboxylate transport system permease small subunit
MPTVRMHPSRLARIADAFEVASRGLNALAEFALWILVALTILVTFIQVVFRYGLDSSLSWSEELSRYLFVWTIFIGASVAARRRQHIFVEVLIALFPARLREWVDSLIVIVSIIFFAIFAYVGWLLVQNAWQQYSTALDIRIAWVYAAAPLGAVLSILHFATGLLQRWCGKESGLPATISGSIEGLE